MRILKIITLIVKLLIEFGPSIFNIGKKIYEMVEQWANESKASGEIVTSSAKAVKFNELAKLELSTKNTVLSPARMNKLREGVWALNNKQKAFG